MPSPLRLAFLGTPDFAVASLEALVAAGHDVAAVYSQPPRPAGRGKKDRASPVHLAAEAHGIAVRTPASLRTREAQAEFAALDLDAAVVAAYGLILPKAILDAPRLGCLNVHASLLPRWRGAAPIQRAILAGDAESGVTIMQMDEGLDTGGMLLARKQPILPTTTAGELHDALAALGAALIVPALQGRADGSLSAQPQPSEGVTYAKKLTREEERIDWTQSALSIERQVRAFAPAPGAWFEHAGERIKILAAAPASGSGEPGTVIDALPRIACGDGTLLVTRLQRAGRGAMSAADFLRGFALPVGTKLG
jgi:methionyl-tRNA formyltransferase